MDNKIKKTKLNDDYQGIKILKESYYQLKRNAADSKMKFYEYIKYLADLKITK